MLYVYLIDKCKENVSRHLPIHIPSTFNSVETRPILFYGEGFYGNLQRLYYQHLKAIINQIRITMEYEP